MRVYTMNGKRNLQRKVTSGEDIQKEDNVQKNMDLETAKVKIIRWLR